MSDEKQPIFPQLLGYDSLPILVKPQILRRKNDKPKNICKNDGNVSNMLLHLTQLQVGSLSLNVDKNKQFETR